MLAQWAGIYRLTADTANTTACDAEGSSVLSQRMEPYFAAVGVVANGRSSLQIVSCLDPTSCDSKVTTLRSGGPFGYEFGFVLQCANTDGSFDGNIRESGIPSNQGTCDMPTLLEGVLTRLSTTAIRIDARTYNGDSYPQDAQGVCWASGSNASTSSPCSRYEVMLGDYVQALPP